MSRFPRPENTITSASDLRCGDRIWHVYGIWPPQMGGECVVTREAIPFRQHPEYDEIHRLLRDEAVFDERSERGFTHMAFASDCNTVSGRSHNDNYVFRSEADARTAVEFLRSQWEAVPGLIQEEVARREEDMRFYDSLSDWPNDNDDYPIAAE